MLAQRLQTGVILAVIVILLLLYAPKAFVITAMILLACAGAYEWSHFCIIKRLAHFRWIYVATCGLVSCLMIHWAPVMMQWLLVIWWLLAVGIIFAYRPNMIIKAHYNTLIAILGICLISGFIQSCYQLYLISAQWLLLMITLVILVDSGAYFSGRFFGGYLLLPTVSPKKTWAGVLGGWFCCAIGVLIMSPYFSILTKGATFSPIVLIALIFLVSYMGVIGDLFESMLKRYAGCKDSGSLLPGHGGVLDRIDGLLAVVPCIALYCHYYL